MFTNNASNDWRFAIFFSFLTPNPQSLLGNLSLFSGTFCAWRSLGVLQEKVFPHLSRVYIRRGLSIIARLCAA